MPRWWITSLFFPYPVYGLLCGRACLFFLTPFDHLLVVDVQKFLLMCSKWYTVYQFYCTVYLHVPQCILFAVEGVSVFDHIWLLMSICWGVPDGIRFIHLPTVFEYTVIKPIVLYKLSAVSFLGCWYTVSWLLWHNSRPLTVWECTVYLPQYTPCGSRCFPFLRYCWTIFCVFRSSMFRCWGGMQFISLNFFLVHHAWWVVLSWILVYVP